MKKVVILIGILGLTLGLAACNQNNADKDPADKGEGTKTEQNSAASNQPEKTGNGNLAANDFFEPFKGEIEHIHGLGYAGNQNALFFAAHDGLKVYENGKWYKTKKENNDYMGFNAVKGGFYASGHPGEDSKLPNPFGIKRSFDNGQTLETLVLEGETDFHAMGVGFNNEVIYVMNPEKNSIMDTGKFYRSEDQAKTWKQTSAKGLNDEILSIAVHPSNPDIMAAAGKEGIYLSKDKGESFELITKGMQGTAVFFTEDSLWYGGYNGQALLMKSSLSDGAEESVKLPEMEQDAVLYLAQNPQNDKEISIVSFNGNIYITKDGAQSWELLAEEGTLK